MSADCTGSIAIGEVKTCTITNDDVVVILDSDGDGILNDVDVCPTISAIVNGVDRDANNDGCPDTAEELLQEIQATNLEKGIKNSLSKKVNAAIKSYGEGKDKAGNKQLNALIKELEAQKGKKVPTELADLFIAKANNIIALHLPSPADQLHDLINFIKNMGLDKNTEKKLTHPLQKAVKDLTDKKTKNDDICKELDNFIKQVDKREMKDKLTAAQADELKESADAIKISIGCA